MGKKNPCCTCSAFIFINRYILIQTLGPEQIKKIKHFSFFSFELLNLPTYHEEHAVASFRKAGKRVCCNSYRVCMCVCGTDKSSCISITCFHDDRTHKALGSLQTNSEKQCLPKQHERNVVKVALYCLKVRKYQKLGCQYNLNSTLLCIFIMIQSLIT